MLFTKCILSSPVPEDGVRISVMSRHTLRDGITRDIRITEFDFHFPNLGPSSSLIGSYYKRGLLWKDFERMYLFEMKECDAIFSVKTIAKTTLDVDVTLLCIEETSEFCHRRLLAEECQRHEPNLKIEHR